MSENTVEHFLSKAAEGKEIIPNLIQAATVLLDMNTTLAARVEELGRTVDDLVNVTEPPKGLFPPVASGGPQREPSPIPLNEAQEATIKQWASDDRLWTTRETVEFNLTTFARCILRDDKPPPPAPAATERQEPLSFEAWWAGQVVRLAHQSVTLSSLDRHDIASIAYAAGRESAQPQPAPDLGAAFEQWWENEGSKMPEWPPKPHAKQIFKAGAACRVSPWRDASKEKPEEGTPVWIAWNPPRGEKGEAWSRVAIYQKDGHWTSNLGGRINDRDPDYWMPLPPIPKGEAS